MITQKLGMQDLKSGAKEKIPLTTFQVFITISMVQH